jgi:hypothetical protein
LIGRVEDPGNPEETGDDLLVTLRRHGDEILLAPPGSFERIRRGAARRRRVRAAVAGGLAAVAVAVVLPMYLEGTPVTTVPAPSLVPPAASGAPSRPAPSPTSLSAAPKPNPASPSSRTKGYPTPSSSVPTFKVTKAPTATQTVLSGPSGTIPTATPSP